MAQVYVGKYIWVWLNPDTGDLVVFTDIPEGRNGLATFSYGHKASGVEAAARWWVQGTGHLALQDDALAGFLYKWVGDGYSGEQGSCVGM